MMADFLLLSRLEEYINRGKILPAYFQKSAGAYGVFTPYTSFADCTCAEFLGDNAEPSECFVKFAPMCEKAGGADSVRDIRGMFTRFFTGEGHYDLLCQSFPVFYINRLEKLQGLLEALGESADSNTRDESRLWQFVADNPESLSLIIYLYSDRGTVKSYVKQRYYSFFSSKWINSEGRDYSVRYRWIPLCGEETITASEAEFLAGYDRDCCRADLYDRIDKKNYPEFELQVQLSDTACNKSCEYSHTEICEEGAGRYIPAGRLRLTGRPADHINEVDSIAFTPFNLVSGIEPEKDELSEGIAFLFSNCGRQRGGRF